MQTSFEPPQTAPQKVKNILIRRTCSTRVEPDSHYQHPETPYILKYAPKYYKSLTLQTSCQSPLLSKVKKIKKLQSFTGYFDRHLPRQLWFNLLGNSRKNIEEAPQISSSNKNVKPNKAFWEKLNQQKLRFFCNLTKILLQRKDENDVDSFLSYKEAFVKHIWNLRNLKNLKIMIKAENLNNIKWILDKLNEMDGLLKRLETLSLSFYLYDEHVQDLFQKKKLFSHVTGLNLSLKFDPIFAEIPLICKKLNSLGLDLCGVDGKPEFRALLTKIQQITQLKRLEFDWPRDEKNFWSHFKPQPSLEHLLLKFHACRLVDDGFSEGDNIENVVAHWEVISEMKSLEFSAVCDRPEHFSLVKLFMTKVMKKVQKLGALKIFVGALFGEYEQQKTYEPFIVEDVPHLYESLEKFDYHFFIWARDAFGKFDLKTLMPFRNLKSLKLDGHMEFYENVEEIVSLLEGNQDPVLEFNLKKYFDSPPVDWLSETLKILEKKKKVEKNLKVIIELVFDFRNYMEILEALCNAIQSVKTIEGLKLCLNFNDGYDRDPLPAEALKELLGRYPEIRNLNVVVSNGFGSFKWIKIDGEKEQFI